MLDKCDGKKIAICNSCGLPAVSNTDAGIYICKNCPYTTFSISSTSSATLSYINYLRALGIGMKFKLEQPKFIGE
jgi:ribosomal protein L37AE/L43A